MTLCEEVKRLLRDSTSLEKLVEGTTINYSSARRYYLGEIKNIPANALLEIAAHVTKKRGLKTILNSLQKNSLIRMSLEKSFRLILSDEEEIIRTSDNEILNKALVSDTHFKVFVLSQNDDGTTVDFIKENFGLAGLQALEDLKEKLVVAEVNGIVVDTNDNYQVDIDNGLKFAPTFFNFVKKSNFKNGKNIFNLRWNKVSSEARRDVIQVLTNAMKDVSSIMEEDKGERTEPIFTMILSDDMEGR
tara:strand:+ start:1277 stop:2014 length:738 start_codon:yes stop_codon:yes gene_type:complete